MKNKKIHHRGHRDHREKMKKDPFNQMYSEGAYTTNVHEIVGILINANT